MTPSARAPLPRGHWLIKVGSNILLSDQASVDRLTFASLVRGIDALKRQGIRVTLVSSGAVALGRRTLRGSPLERVPVRRDVASLQALAALGQPHLMRLWSEEFAHYEHTVAQLLFSRSDLDDRPRYLNARRALERLHQLGVIPVINENDTVATEELRFGDNDQLAAMTCGLVGADLLVILSDVEGVLDRQDGQLTARIVQEAADAPRLDEVAGGTSSGVGTGGMRSKVNAARIAARFGVPTCIAPGRKVGVLEALLGGEDVGTLLTAPPPGEHVVGKRVWLGAGARPQGQLVCDEGARSALLHRGASLLPRGVVEVRGEFQEGAVVELVSQDGGIAFALGVIHYSSEAARRLCGMRAEQIEEALGYRISDELVHRDNLVILAS